MAPDLFNKDMLPKEILSGLLKGDRRILSKAITLIESLKPEHRSQASEVLAGLPIRGGTLRVGICGTPGAGKSTMIETLGLYTIEQGCKPAILAMDPSSVQFGGSILGDKTRMPNLSYHPKAYVRPSPTKGALGGVTSACSENILLCEAAGYDTVLVETVGLGQNETTIDEVTDVVVLVTSPAGGDSLQGIKKGVMEVADIIVVNKAEEPLTEKAKQSKRELESAIMLNVRRYPEWIPQVLTCSGLKGIGVPELWAAITKCSKTLEMRILDKRKKQRIKNCERMLEDLVKRHLKEMTSTQDYIEIRDSLEQNQIIPRVAAVKLLNLLHT